MQVLTIGGYGFDERTFVQSLISAGVDVFIDIRQRRGVRGSKYSFLNSRRLQKLLADAGVRYQYEAELAPTTEARSEQKAADKEAGITKTRRTSLDSAFVDRYCSETLERYDVNALDMKLRGAASFALFCVECSPAACHRSLAAAHLARFYSSEVRHLTP
jgi:uncharacterized protein (DUF488 family)